MEIKKVYLMTRLVILLLVHSLCPTGLARAEPLTLESSQQIVLTNSTSSSLFIENAIESETHCVIRCMARNCSLATMNKANGQCQLIVLHDASDDVGPPGTHVRRVVGAEAGDRVWKTPNLEQQLRSLQKKIILFNNTNIGSTGTLQTARINQTACYSVEASGASGGTSYYGIVGGKGAKMVGKFNLTAGTELTIVVGQRGGNASQVSSNAGAGGGGGSFVYINATNSLLIAAGGGGGGIGGCPDKPVTGSPGQATQNGSNTPFASTSIYMGYGGSNGEPGIVNLASANGGTNSLGGAGAGWKNKSVVWTASEDARGGGSRADGWTGGQAGVSNSAAVGGFGGGGGSGSNCGGAGGGGGYSGGGAATACCTSGGGGGSFCSGSDCSGTTGGNVDSEHGSVVIQKC